MLGVKEASYCCLVFNKTEYVALSSTSAELICLRNLLGDLGVEGNHLLNKWEHRQLKHIDVKYNFIRDLHQNIVLSVKYVASRGQKADIVTKSLNGDRFIKLRSSLGFRYTYLFVFLTLIFFEENNVKNH
jgi:hypothetical protein